MKTVQIVMVLIQVLGHVSAQNYDFFHLALTWPGSFCETENQICCQPPMGKPQANFTIHGLWPSFILQDGPYDCNRRSLFNPALISNLRVRMDVRWPSFNCPTAEQTMRDLWKHEWRKHGTCSESVFNQHEYFERTLNLTDEANILEILSAKGIEPNGNFYSFMRIRNAITAATGHVPRVTCNTYKNKKIQLYEIHRCVDKIGSNFFDCPNYPPPLSAQCPPTMKMKFPRF